MGDWFNSDGKVFVARKSLAPLREEVRGLMWAHCCYGVVRKHNQLHLSQQACTAPPQVGRAYSYPWKEQLLAWKRVFERDIVFR